MNVLIVDDHPLARRGLAAIVRDAFADAAIHHADGTATALRLATAHRPELVLTDMHMPGSMPTRELCVQLRAALPAAPIVLVTAFDQPVDVRTCLEAGASACLLKDSAEDELVAALRAVVAGQVIIDARVAQVLAVQLAGGGPGNAVVHLTAREREVLECLADGQSNRQISERLIITEATVKGYVSSLLAKLQADSRLQAVVRASKAGLL